MAQIDLQLPEVAPVLRPNGEAVVELRQNGEVIGELNFTKLFTYWFEQLGLIKPERHLKVVR